MTLDLEVFKKMSQEEIKEYGKNLPDGFTYDENGNILTHKTYDGFWREYTYDEKGNELTYKDSDGTWYEYTYDKNGKELTYKNSNGFWEEYTYADNGNVLTYKDSHGVDVKYFFWGKRYNLGYDKNTKKYHAGCQELNYEECEKYYEEYIEDFVDSHNFIEAIREHQKALTESEKSV